MANKELATWTEVSAVVTFFLGDEEYAAPIANVNQILRDVPMTRVPNVSHHVEGVLNLRGKVVPVIDVKHLLGLGIRRLGDDHRLVIVDLEGRLVGLSVDRVGGISRLAAGEVGEAPPDIIDRLSARFVSGAARRQGASLPMLDLGQIVSAAEQGMAAALAEPGSES
jgi:purine-binding chemotaxis protein CheW